MERAGLCPAAPRDRVSVYNIYMYVLFPVLYEPCPLSGYPHKSRPQNLTAWFLDARRDRAANHYSNDAVVPPSIHIGGPTEIYPYVWVISWLGLLENSASLLKQGFWNSEAGVSR